MTDETKPNEENNEQTEEQVVAAKAVEQTTPEEAAYELDGEDNQVDIEIDAGSDADTDVAKLAAELADAKDQVLRAQADVQNARRRAEKDVENARKFALEKFSGDLLPVVDNLERALESIDTEDDTLKPITEGVELTLKSFTDVLTKFSVEQINPVGEPFDPQVHEAVGMVPNPDVEPNTVLHVVQKGYTLNGRVIRAAMVMVAKAP